MRSELVCFALVGTCLLCLIRPSLTDVATSEVSKPHEDPKTAKVAADPKASGLEKPTDTAEHNDNSKSNKTKSSDNNNNGGSSVAPPPAPKSNLPKQAPVDKGQSSTVKVKSEVAAAPTAETSTKAPEQPGFGHATSLNSGAIERGFYVFVGLSVIAMAYMLFRSFRFNKSRTQMVRKYGVLAHKQDIEMRPLPLDEDDEDDTTVFDASGLSPARSSRP